MKWYPPGNPTMRYPYEVAASAGDECECASMISAIGTGHLAVCANRKPGDTRRHVTAEQVIEALNRDDL